MSNLGFMQSTVKRIEELYKFYMTNAGKSPSEREKKEYTQLTEKLEKMQGAIGDTELYNILIKKLKSCDLTKVTEDRRKLAKSGTNYKG